MSVTAISSARNNAELIVQARDLGYLRDDWETLDPTWGLGKFWTLWRPATFTASDLNPARCPGLGRAIPGSPVDFTKMPYADASFDAVVFDPPYKLNGTSTGKGAASCDEAFGVSGPAVRWQDRHALIRAGITDCLRVLRLDGMLLVKCQDQVCSGKKRWQTHEFTRHAEGLGCRLVDLLHLPGGRQWRYKAKLTAITAQRRGVLERAEWDRTAKHEIGISIPVASLNIRRDGANWHPTLKAVIDGLVDHGMLPDDSGAFVVTSEPTFHARAENPWVIVTVNPLERAL